MKEKVIFIGSSQFVIPILEVLRKNFDLKFVLTTEKNSTDAVLSYCIKNKIPYLSVSNLSDSTLNSQLSTLNSEAAVLADFGLIIPAQILNLFPKGIINVHPSLLPKYRGPTPVQTAILNGEKITGISIIKLDEEIDHGPILGQEKAEILPTDTSETLYKRLFAGGSNLLLKVLDEYLKGNLKLTAQNHSDATFTKPLTRQDGYIDISNLKTQISKLKLDQMIRAYYPWPGVWTKLKVQNEKLKVIKFLPEKKIQVEGKKPVDIETFKRGYPETRQWLEKLLGQLA